MTSPRPPQLPTWLRIAGLLVLAFVVLLFLYAATSTLD